MKREAGFTLFEVLIAIGIFMLLVGGIFASVRAAFVTSAQVASRQLESERSDAFQQLLRKFFAALPADAKTELRLRNLSGRGDVVELLVWPAPPFLRFGSDPGDGVAISGLPDGRGNFRISLGYFRADDSPEDRDKRLQEGKWLPLMPDVAEMRWRMAPMRNPVMAETWTAGNGRPGIAELTLRMATGDSGTYSYWVPPLQHRSFGGGDEGAPPTPDEGSPGPQR
jgi:hypothetical protein